MQVDFEKKKKMLFESLESAEKSLQGSSLEQPIHDYRSQPYRQQRKRNRDEYVEKYKHKDSLFKRPELPIGKCLRSRQRPEYEVNIKTNSLELFASLTILRRIQKNPNKWQHYTLEDVSDTSDRTNTSAAFNFLKELEDRRQTEDQIDDEDCGSSQKIVFKKSIKLKPKDDEADPLLNVKKVQGLKIIMPEYVVGEKKQKPRKDLKPKDRQSSSKEAILLSHLNEDDEDEET